jgi:hypothetical protein
MSAERAVILTLLSDDRRWTRTELEREVGITKDDLRGVLATLVVEGVAVLDRDAVVANRCARHLDALGLISV